VALQLSKKGIRNIRLLEGGYEAWLEHGFIVEDLALSSNTLQQGTETAS
jgi:3-mercaptopyruvate sulfurtransferase SseA